MRRRPTRKTALAAAIVTAISGVSAVLAPVARAKVVDTQQPVVTAAPYRFAAAPDIFNQDIGDVRGQIGWNEGDPNSWTPQLEAATDTVLGEIAAQDPRALLVAGDLVEGHWGRDDMGTGIFGPTRTTAQRDASLRRAGAFYHGQNKARLLSAGLDVYAAVGDHDIGDNPWAGKSDRLEFKRAHIRQFRSMFARAYNTNALGTPRFADRPFGSQWEDTAYATQLSPDVLLVTLDVFDKTGNGVKTEVVGEQLDWLRRTLADAKARGVPWVIVQGHVPVLAPVRERSSSGLTLRDGARSPLWRAMVAGGVDLYLCGEVHDTSMRQSGGVTQIATGTPLYMRRATYLTADVYADRMDLTVHEFTGTRGYAQPIWQGSNMKTEGNLAYPDPSNVVGTMSLLADHRALGATGKLIPYSR